jgi:flagellar motor protein MotB
MNTTTKTASLAAFLGAALLGGCVANEDLTQRIHDLDSSLAASRKANDELRSRVSAAEKERDAARAEAEKLTGQGAAYGAAQKALEERIKELEGAFPPESGTASGGEPGDISIERIAGGFKFVVQGEILFRTGEAELSEEGKAALGKIANALKGRPERVRVEGHTDNVPIAKPETKAKYPFGNLDLSLDRALRVGDALIRSGVEASRVSCGGYGEHQPRADNASAEGKRKNRRVEILVQAP